MRTSFISFWPNNALRSQKLRSLNNSEIKKDMMKKVQYFFYSKPFKYSIVPNKRAVLEIWKSLINKVFNAIFLNQNKNA